MEIIRKGDRQREREREIISGIWFYIYITIYK